MPKPEAIFSKNVWKIEADNLFFIYIKTLHDVSRSRKTECKGNQVPRDRSVAA